MVILVSSQFSSAQRNPGDVAEVLEDEFNIDADKIPSSPEEIQRKYLQQQWEELAKNNTYYGKIHNTFTNNQLFFQIVFGSPYQFSLTFLLIVALWFFVLFHVSRVIEGAGIITGWKAFLVGVAVAIVVAQLRILKLISTFAIDVTFSKDSWWIRVIFAIIVLGLIAVAHVASSLLEKKLNKDKKAKKEEEFGQNLRELKSLRKNIKD